MSRKEDYIQEPSLRSLKNHFWEGGLLKDDKSDASNASDVTGTADAFY